MPMPRGEILTVTGQLPVRYVRAQVHNLCAGFARNPTIRR